MGLSREEWGGKLLPELGPQFLHFTDEFVGLDPESIRQQENRGEAGLPLGTLQQGQRGGMQTGALGEGFMGKPLLLAKTEEDVGEGFGGIQAGILKFVDPD
jgi:hypothetical protein